MKRKFLPVFCCLLAFVSALVVPVSEARADSYFPNTPIEFHYLRSALFSQLDLTTGNNDYFQNDNWKYYYWCDFTPQYSAEYTVTVTTKKKMKTELYDADENFISASYSPDEKNEDNRFVFSHTAYLEKGKTYYYKFAFTNGYFNSCGPFNIKMVSGGAAEIPSDDNLHLYVNGSKNQQVYELSEFSTERLLDDLSMKVVYADGKLYTWERKATIVAYLNGCDILLDLSDCNETVGVHTVVAHFMGYTTSATFEIVDCIHTYSESALAPGWLTPAGTVFTCSKCGYSCTGDYTQTGAEIYSDFMSHLNSTSESGDFDPVYDLDSDGTVNVRDYKLLLNIYNEAWKEMESRLNSNDGDANYDPVYDLNADGVINIRDFSALSKTKP